jgi:hypothetical protein
MWRSHVFFFSKKHCFELFLALVVHSSCHLPALVRHLLLKLGLFVLVAANRPSPLPILTTACAPAPQLYFGWAANSHLGCQPPHIAILGAAHHHLKSKLSFVISYRVSMAAALLPSHGPSAKGMGRHSPLGAHSLSPI